jgi:hypothetical protein
MADQEYVSIVLTRTTPRVDVAPETALVSVQLLRDMGGGYFVGPDVIFVGHDPDGVAVYYQIVGWHPTEKALIVRRYTDLTLVAEG